MRAANFVTTHESIRSAAVSVGVSDEVADAAAAHVLAGTAGGILMSGRQGAGKDTVAPMVLAACGITDAIQCRVSDAIKDEMDIVLAEITGQPLNRAIASIAGPLDLRHDHAEQLVRILWDVTREHGHGLTGRTRTAQVRLALQYLGYEARIETHPDYWVSACYQRVIPLLAEGKIVYLTDGRFPREVETARSIGLYTVRLFVSREVQFERIHARDGHDPDVASLDHPGETLLDDYEGFNLVVDNSGALEPVVQVIADNCGLKR